MNLFDLIKRSLSYYRRRNVGLFLTAVVSAAVLAGALFVGDSVRFSLRRIVDLRLGKVETVLVGGNHFFEESLAGRLAKGANANTSPVLQLAGMISNSDGSRRIGSANVIGVDKRFFAFAGAEDPFGDDLSGIVINEQVASELEIKSGDEVLVRIGKPGSMSRDIGLMPVSDLTVTYRTNVKAVAGDEGFGRFGLAANQVAPMNVFVPLETLAEIIGRDGLCNNILIGGDGFDSVNRDELLKSAISLGDLGLELNKLEGMEDYDLRSRRVFIDDGLANAAMKVDGAVGYLTYFVNEIRFKDRVTPYSMVAATAGSTLGSEDIVINKWLANDLGVKVADTVELEYFVLAENRGLETRQRKIVVRKIVENEGDLGDRNLMPDYPGLADQENCSDWDPGIPIDLDKIRDKDEDYWDKYRGTPKAYVSLAVGREMWANRFGNLTSVRYPAGKNKPEEIAESILKNVDPSKSGLVFLDVRKSGIKAGGESTDFGQLFLGLSMFLIAAGMILTGLVFAFGVERRREEAGMLLAVGFNRTLVKRIFMAEAAVIAMTGSVAGSIAGLLYTKAMIAGLAGVWHDAVASTDIVFYWKVSTLLAGIVCGFSVSLFSVWLTLRKHLRESSHELMSLTEETLSTGGIGGAKRFRIKVGAWISVLSAVSALVIITAYRGGGAGQQAAGAFFAAGSLLLISGILLCSASLNGFYSTFKRTVSSVGGFALRNAARRSSRSVAVIAMLAAGTFLVVSIGAFRHGPMSNPADRDSGTGGFTLFAETSVPVITDLDGNDEKSKLGFDGNDFADLQVVQMRVRGGDDASCLNLNRAQQPAIIGVDPYEFDKREAFGKVKYADEYGDLNGWSLLDSKTEDGVVNAIADSSTVVWAMGKKPGDTIDYVDDDGNSFKIRIAGVIGNSVLQGKLIISESNFVERFGSIEGYRMFLVDIPADKSKETADKLSAGLVDYGIEISTTVERLGRFMAVENTYLSIFQVLGGLGVLLGTVGLGLVVHINVLERRGELAMLRAVGFKKRLLVKIVVMEHAGLLAAGMILGVVAAIIAVLPALRTPGTEIGCGFVAIIVTFIAFFGIVVIRISTIYALSGRLIEALRNE